VAEVGGGSHFCVVIDVDRSHLSWSRMRASPVTHALCLGNSLRLLVGGTLRLQELLNKLGSAVDCKSLEQVFMLVYSYWWCHDA
jgi:hypothetical protein